MKRSLYAFAAAAVLAATLTTTAQAATSVDLRVSVGDRYDGATLAFRSEPRVVLVPDTKVYYVRDRDCDLYRYGRYWYFVEDGFWYRASSWRGPFVHIRVGSVPRSVVTVPVKYRRHWKNGPPSHAVAQGYYKDRDRDGDRDRGRGHKRHKH
ncbi:MAG TPA: hypothetical protein VFU59_09745 [Candidatus Eisenbacteria bacterium]|nr:hypothetical protein [Candidatus Eisenbacteria bacterium]